MLTRVKNILVVSSLFCALSCSLFLFSSNTNAFKYCILGLSFIALLCNFRTQINFSSLKELLNGCFPWLPLFLSLLLLTFIHGIHGYSIYINAFILYCLLFLTLNHHPIRREVVVIALAINVLVISSLALIYYFTFGIVDSGLLGINKNKLIPGITLLMTCCATELIINYKRYSTISLAIIILSILSNLLTIIVSEVRTALLPLFAFLPLLLIYKPRQRLQVLTLCLLMLFCMMLAFFFTGRMQQGLSDLENYQSGHLNTSWGIRLELWKFAIEAFLINPLYGWGAKAFDAITATGVIFSVPSFKAQHFHSDFFNTLASGGIIGLCGWVMTIILLARAALKDPVRLTLLISSLAMGLCERFWFNNESSLFVLLTAWLLLYFSENKHSPNTQISE